MDIRQVFAANLRRIRHEKGFSQEELANHAEIDRSYVSKIEKGSTWVGLEIIAKLSDVLGIEEAQLLTRRGKKTRR